MDRSLAARLGRSFAPAGLVGGRRGAQGRAARTRRAGSAAGLGGTLYRAHGALAQIWRRQRLRVGLLCVLGVLTLLVGGWLFLRHSSLAAVDQVHISGVHGAEATQIDAALRHAARHMSTLDVQRGALLAAVAQFPLVRDLSVSPSFPHGLQIRVSERPPVAVLTAGGMRTAVAADGVVLGRELIAGTLPSINMDGIEPLPGARVASASTRAELSVLGAAPATLLGWVQRVFSGPEGLTVTMRDGLAIYFGNATRAHAKWVAAARVLADPSSAGATYLDVRLPERPAAGSAGGSLADSSSATTQVSASDPSAAALAATLDEAVAGGASATASAATPSAAAAESQSQASAVPQSEGNAATAVAPTSAAVESPASTTESPSAEASSSTSG